MVSTVKVTGIIGAGRGTGVTHFSIRAANYFCSWKQRKTAVIQWNSHKDTERMRNFLEASGKEGGALRKNLSGSWRWIFIVRADRRYWLRVWKKNIRRSSLTLEK